MNIPRLITEASQIAMETANLQQIGKDTGQWIIRDADYESLEQSILIDSAGPLEEFCDVPGGVDSVTWELIPYDEEIGVWDKEQDCAYNGEATSEEWENAE